MQHSRVVGGSQRAEARHNGADSLITIDLQIQNFHRQRVPHHGPFDVKRAGQRVISFDQAELVSRLLNGVAERIQRVRLENITRLQPRHWSRGAIHIFHVVDRRVILHHSSTSTLPQNPRRSRDQQRHYQEIGDQDASSKSKIYNLKSAILQCLSTNPAIPAAAIITGSGIFHFISTARLTSAISAVGRSYTERRASTMTAPAIAPVAAAVTPRTNAFSCGFLAHRL